MFGPQGEGVGALLVFEIPGRVIDYGVEGDLVAVQEEVVGVLALDDQGGDVSGPDGYLLFGEIELHDPGPGSRQLRLLLRLAINLHTDQDHDNRDN